MTSGESVSDRQGVAVAVRNYELHLEGLATPSGQISFHDLVSLGSSLQLVATRIARQLLDAERQGPAPDLVDRMGEIRLRGVRDGSTTLVLEIGEDGALPLIGDEADQFVGRFEETMSAVSENRPPEWASPAVRQSVSKMIKSLRTVGAQQATWSSPTREHRRAVRQTMVVPDLDDTVWLVTAEHESETVKVSGKLDLVDLRTGRFRVRDDVGHDVRLEEVVDVDAASRLIGQRVTVTGTADRVEGRLLRILEPTLAPERFPAVWTVPIIEAPPVGSPPPRVGISGVTAKEVEELLREIHA